MVPLTFFPVYGWDVSGKEKKLEGGWKVECVGLAVRLPSFALVWMLPHGVSFLT